MMYYVTVTYADGEVYETQWKSRTIAEAIYEANWDEANSAELNEYPAHWRIVDVSMTHVVDVSMTHDPTFS
jgi:adenylate cyclase